MFEESDSEEDSGVTPGPGYYNASEKLSAFLPKQVPEKMQFFGSTVERFNPKKPKTEDQMLGPGYYSKTKSLI